MGFDGVGLVDDGGGGCSFVFDVGGLMENKVYVFLVGLFMIGLVIFIGLVVMWFNCD